MQLKKIAAMSLNTEKQQFEANGLQLLVILI